MKTLGTMLASLVAGHAMLASEADLMRRMGFDEKTVEAAAQREERRASAPQVVPLSRLEVLRVKLAAEGRFEEIAIEREKDSVFAAVRRFQEASVPSQSRWGSGPAGMTLSERLKAESEALKRTALSAAEVEASDAQARDAALRALFTPVVTQAAQYSARANAYYNLRKEADLDTVGAEAEAKARPISSNDLLSWDETSTSKPRAPWIKRSVN